jgi:hypothetical protein
MPTPSHRKGLAGFAAVLAVAGLALADPALTYPAGAARSAVNVTVNAREGWAPVTFTTGTPRTSTCAVTYDLVTGWGGGFVAA